MRFSEQWLREWVDPDISTETLCEQLTMAGLEVDTAEPVAPPLDGVIVGRIATIEPHPDADRLRVCHVDAGDGTPLQVVCGAPNAREGLHVPLATIGTTLGEMKIKRSKLRGVESFGMLCSAVELGLGEESGGLLELPDDTVPGTPLVDLLGLTDTAIEIDLTPNRGDCLGVAGVAREVGVLNRAPVTPVVIDPVPAVIDATFPVELASPEGCPRYVGRVIRGIDPHATTPLWMQERLRRSGIRSLGPLVDVTNYVMLELGQPMHAFDLGRLKGGIVVRWAAAGEKLLLLDGREVDLDPETLVIADHEEAVAIAGVMGGELSGISEETETLFLESAYFAPPMISGRARRYNMHTDAAHRFERGVDPMGLQVRAMERATALLLDIVGGEPGPVVDTAVAEHLPQPATIVLRHARISALLGIEIAAGEVEDILKRLGMVLTRTDDGWQVQAPGYRFDIAIEADLIEELVRIHGYHRVPSTRAHGTMAIRPEPEDQPVTERLAGVLVERGYHEAITFSFVDPERLKLLDPAGSPIALANPISSDMAVMRTTLWAGLLDAVLHNRNRQQERVRLFETGLRYLRIDGKTHQEPMLAGVACGRFEAEQWGSAPREVDFFDVKGDVEALLALTGIGSDIIFISDKHPALHPGQAAALMRDGRNVGWIGSLNPQVAQKLGLKGRLVLFELSLSALGRGRVPTYSPLSRFPAVRRDLAVVVRVGITADALCNTVRAAAGEWLHELQLFDIYSGKGIDSDRKSVAMGLTFQHPSRTLTDDEIDALQGRVLERLGNDLGAELRE